MLPPSKEMISPTLVDLWEPQLGNVTVGKCGHREGVSQGLRHSDGPSNDLLQVSGFPDPALGSWRPSPALYGRLAAPFTLRCC